MQQVFSFFVKFPAMSIQKIFAGPRIRRIRTSLELTQTSMAEKLGISPSYLNLIERNQRPLTVQLVLKLASVFNISPEELQGGGDAGSVAALKEVFSDPLLEGELPGDSEILELSECAPNAAVAIAKLHRAYRESLDRLSDLTKLLNQAGHQTLPDDARLPIDEVTEKFETHQAHFAALEDAASRIRGALKPESDLREAMKVWLRSNHGIAIKVLPSTAMPNWRKKYDRHSQRLLLSERLSTIDQQLEIASEVVLLAERQRIDDEVAYLKLSSDEANRLARFELARYTALAVMMPYEPVLEVATRSRYDLEIISARFGVSFSHAASRVITLQRHKKAGVPMFLMEVDQAGNHIRRTGARGFPAVQFGGDCPKLAVHQAFANPGQIFVEKVMTPEGTVYITVARTVMGPRAGFGERPRRTAFLVGFEDSFGKEVVYSDSLPVGNPNSGEPGQSEENSFGIMPIGPSCRLCERPGCLSRAHPPLTRPLGLDEMVSGMSVYDFQ